MAIFVCFLLNFAGQLNITFAMNPHFISFYRKRKRNRGGTFACNGDLFCLLMAIEITFDAFDAKTIDINRTNWESASKRGIIFFHFCFKIDYQSDIATSTISIEKFRIFESGYDVI